MSEPKIVWSLDGESFNYHSLGDALGMACGDLEAGRVVYFGVASKPGTGFVDAADVLELINVRAYDVGGEHAEDFPEVSDEATRELDAFLSAWQGKYCQPTFWTVDHIKEYKFTAADLEDQP